MAHSEEWVIDQDTQKLIGAAEINQHASDFRPARWEQRWNLIDVTLRDEIAP